MGLWPLCLGLRAQELGFIGLKRNFGSWDLPLSLYLESHLIHKFVLRNISARHPKNRPIFRESERFTKNARYDADLYE